jgi:hypothetical protein
MALDLFEDPEKKSNNALALALANLGGYPAVGVDAISAGASVPALLQAIMRNQSSSSAQTSGQLPTTEPGNSGWAGTPDAGVYGAMTPDERSQLGTLGMGWGALSTAANLAGVANLGGLFGSAVRGGILGFDALGLNAGIRGVTQLSPVDLAELGARYGYGMPNSNPSPASDPTARGFGGYNYGDLSYGNMPGMGPQGGVTAGDGGEGGPAGSGGLGGTAGAAGAGDPGSGGGEERGGVVFAPPGQPQNRTFGEGVASGGETGIFIPEYMKRPGLQGNEAQVRNALMRAILSLR